MREACRSCSAAFLGSCNATRQLSNQLMVTRSKYDSLQSSASPFLIVPGECSAKEHFRQLLPEYSVNSSKDSQHHLQVLLDNNLWSRLKEEANLRDRACMNTISAQYAGAWLRALPNPNLGLAMPSREFVVAVRIRLGLPIFSPPPQSSLCTCGTVLDEYGDHLLGCSQKTNLIIKRHDALCDVIFNTLLIDDSRCRREQRCSSDSGKRPGDIFHPNFQHGLPAYFDVTVRNSLQPSYLVQAASYAGAAAEAGEDEKVLRHETMVSATGSIFEPLVVESLGLWTPNSLRTLKSIARRASFHNGQTFSRTITSLHEQLAVALWLFNSRLILERLALSCKDAL